MNTEELVTGLRGINVVLLSVTALALYVRFSDVWGNAPKGLKMCCIGIVLFFATVAVGTAELYAEAVPKGIRVPFITFSCLLILVGLWRSRHERWFTFDYRGDKKKSPDFPDRESPGSRA